LRPLAVRALYACERVDLGTNGCVLEGGIGRDEGATRSVRTLSWSIYLGSKNGQRMDKFTDTPLEDQRQRPRRRAACAPSSSQNALSRSNTLEGRSATVRHALAFSPHVRYLRPTSQSGCRGQCFGSRSRCFMGW
jgi:hypothetical protein